MSNKPEDEVVDFSNFQTNVSTEEVNQELEPSIQPLPSLKTSITRRLWIMFGILALLILTQVLIFALNRPKKLEAPDGYRIIQQTNGPVRIEKIGK